MGLQPVNSKIPGWKTVPSMEYCKPKIYLQLLSQILLISLLAGCTSLLRHGTWPAPSLVQADSKILTQSVTVRSGSWDLSQAEIAYALAADASQREDSVCVDHYLEAAEHCWREIELRLHEKSIHDCYAAAIYRSALNALVIEGQKHKRLDPRVGLSIKSQQGWRLIPCVYYGFDQTPDDFNSLFTVGPYATKELNQIYRQNGLGVPVVVVRSRAVSQDFQRKTATFPATLVVKHHAENSSPNEPALVLEFHNPLDTSTIDIQGINTPLAIDKSAPTARGLSTTQRNYLGAFLQPSSVATDDSGLFMLEPYVAGKIPVLLVHGLLSDRLTWANVVNELRSREWFGDRFQFWGYQYPTGEPFLGTAAKLRQQFKAIGEYLDPEAKDPALDRVVMIGHSMGGLISKMQIAYSGDSLWNTISKLPFEAVSMEPAIRTKLRDAFFFEASPMVSRVVFVGTPHRGSALAQRAIGRLGSILIEEPAEQKKVHRKLLSDNPGVFSDEFSDRVPTSVDLLEPDSPMLRAMDRLPLEPSVKLHSIIGHGRWMLGNGDSDGVVPVSSATQAGATSEKRVPGKHADLTSDPEMIEELLRILRLHWEEARTEQDSLN